MQCHLAVDYLVNFLVVRVIKIINSVDIFQKWNFILPRQLVNNPQTHLPIMAGVSGKICGYIKYLVGFEIVGGAVHINYKARNGVENIGAVGLKYQFMHRIIGRMAHHTGGELGGRRLKQTAVGGFNYNVHH